MGFSLQKFWSGKTTPAQLTASGSDNSFTSFPVNHGNKHPRNSPGSPVKSTIPAAINANKENVAPLLPPKSPRRSQTSFASTPHQHVLPKTDHYVPVQVAQEERTGSISENKPRVDTIEADDMYPKRRGLYRTLSKVRSLTDMQFSPYAVKDRAPRKSESNVARPSSSASRSPSDSLLPMGSLNQQPQHRKRESNLSLIRRKISSDSLPSLRFHQEKTSPHGASMPVISSAMSSASPWSPRDTATTLDEEHVEGFDVDSATRCIAPPRFHPRNQTSRSPQSNRSSLYATSPGLPGIEEEKENFTACERDSAIHAVHIVGLGLMLDEHVRTRKREPTFEASTNRSTRRRTISNGPKDADAFKFKPLPPDPGRSGPSYKMNSSGWSLASC